MHLPWGTWRALKRAIAITASLAVLLQFALSPPCLFAPAQGFDGICHAPTGDDGNRTPQPLSDHACCHCLACNAGAVAFAPPSAGAQLAAPAWVAAFSVPSISDPPRRAQSYPAYASRAPPMIG